jgi:Tol biopolymer transport system component
MQKTARTFAVYGLILAILLGCNLATPSAPTAEIPTATPTVTFTPTATPIPSPPGQIAYGSDRGGEWQIILMELDSGTETSLTAGSGGQYSRPVFSPDGGRLALREDIGMGGGGIAVMDVTLAGGRPAGSPPVELFHGFADSPTWSPDGSRVGYVTTVGSGRWTAYTVAAGGSPPTAVPALPANATDLAWSPDGMWIAFSNYDNPSKQIKDLYLIHPDGSGLTRLTSTPEADEDGPAWSPDGRQIAFAKRDRSGTIGQRDIYRMNADGSGMTRVTADPASEFDPAWSPDGTRIAFTSTRNEANDGNYEIYVINADGTGELRLTNNRATDRWPTWRATPAGTVAPSCAAGAALAADVTVPAGTRFPSAQEFTKVWRIQNSGACAWSPAGYALRFADGEPMAASFQVPISGAIQPGASFDLSLPLTAPAAPGTHSGRWILIDGAGNTLPGPDGNPLSLQVSIDVLAPSASTLPSALYFLSERSGSGQIWRMETDGATVSQITNEPGPVVAFDLSPADGSIAYVSQNRLVLIHGDGTNRRVIADFGGAGGGAPAWSPDGGTLAYASGGIHLYDVAAGTDRLLIANRTDASPSNFATYAPAEWSPDGSKLLAAIGLYEGAGMGILSALDGSILAEGPWAEMYAWRNDSRAVFLASAEFPMMAGMDPGLQLLAASGGATALLTGAFAWWPFQRPDGQLAYFVHRPADMNAAEYSIRMSASAADGGGEHALRGAPLALDSRDSFLARWAADGSGAAVRLAHQASGATEVLFLPASDDPPVFLMREGTNLQWEE